MTLWITFVDPVEVADLRENRENPSNININISFYFHSLLILIRQLNHEAVGVFRTTCIARKCWYLLNMPQLAEVGFEPATLIFEFVEINWRE